MVDDGFTTWLPLTATSAPFILAPVAFVVLQFNTAVFPAVILDGDAVNELMTGITDAGVGGRPPVPPTVSRAVDLVDPYLLLAVRT
jgi:hypothetical protein